MIDDEHDGHVRHDGGDVTSRGDDVMSTLTTKPVKPLKNPMPKSLAPSSTPSPMCWGLSLIYNESTPHVTLTCPTSHLSGLPLPQIIIIHSQIRESRTDRACDLCRRVEDSKDDVLWRCQRDVGGISRKFGRKLTFASELVPLAIPIPKSLGDLTIPLAGSWKKSGISSEISEGYT